MTAAPTVRRLPDVHPDCKCGHDRPDHQLLRAVCRHKACGCQTYRPKEASQ